MIKGYFIDSEGVIYTCADHFEKGSNALYPVKIEGNTVLALDNEWFVFGEYTLHSTLKELADAIEGSGEDGRVVKCTPNQDIVETPTSCSIITYGVKED